jgi:ADP-ribosyl-[dinitrogen reductase] hydrolase
MDWFHLPIRDVATPGAEFENAWAQVGEGLRARLAQGFDVVVHCKGGLGRAGTIAARLMIELGEDPGRAVEKVRAARPGAIETRTQLEYVMALKAVPERVPATTADGIADRSIGAPGLRLVMRSAPRSSSKRGTVFLCLPTW